MGFFRDINTITKKGKELHEHTDVRAQMAGGIASMQAANAMMAQQTAAATMAVHGVDSTATVAGIRPTGMQVNFDAVVDIDLTVFRNGLPMPMTSRQPIPQCYLHRAQPGTALRVKLDPNDSAAVWIDWATPV